MAEEDRIQGPEDAVRHLGTIFELKFGRFANDVDGTVKHEGELFHRWLASLRER